jgi:predicted PurR-regulated permease PerM
VAPIPFIGPLLTWLPACGWLYAHGLVPQAIGLLCWGGASIMIVDNVIKPYFIGTISRMPVLFMLVALLGGVTAFGPIGLFLGPVLLAITMAVGSIYRDIGHRRRAEDSR